MLKELSIVLFGGILVLGIFASNAVQSPRTQKAYAKKPSAKALKSLPKGQRLATFAAGCFWCIQASFDKVKGVIKTIVGYTGGKIKNPRYKDVAYGRTQHAEAIQVFYDPKKTNYQKLLKIFWRNIDPTAKNRQFYDVGRHYRTAIFYHNDSQRKLAEASKRKLAASGRFKKPIVTEIVKAGPFYNAETYHQQYYKKRPYSYQRYHTASGREKFKKKYWPSCRQ